MFQHYCCKDKLDTRHSSGLRVQLTLKKKKQQGLFVRIITIDTIIITNIIIVIFTVIFMQSKIRMK